MSYEVSCLADGVSMCGAILSTKADNKPVHIVGVAGGSASGKTTLARLLVRQFSSCGILSLDDYYHRGHQPDYDVPAAFDLDLLAKHLWTLSYFSSVASPRYDFATGQRAGVYPFGPFNVIIVEGLYALQGCLRDRLDLKIYVAAPEKECLERRLARDVAERGRTLESVQKRWQTTVTPAYASCVALQKKYADLVVHNRNNKKCL